MYIDGLYCREVSGCLRSKCKQTNYRDFLGSISQDIGPIFEFWTSNLVTHLKSRLQTYVANVPVSMVQGAQDRLSVTLPGIG